MKKTSIRTILQICLIVSVSVLLLDYFNIPSRWGLRVADINWDLSLSVLTNLIVIILYVFTYETLDRRSAEKEDNKKNISVFLLQQSYDQCSFYLKTLNDKFVEKYVVPKMDFDGGPEQNRVVVNLKNAPFANEDLIISLINDGQVSLEEIQGYYRIKQLFSQFITMRTTFYDAPDLYTPVVAELKSAIAEEQKKLQK